MSTLHAVHCFYGSNPRISKAFDFGQDCIEGEDGSSNQISQRSTSDLEQVNMSIYQYIVLSIYLSFHLLPLYPSNYLFLNLFYLSHHHAFSLFTGFCIISTLSANFFEYSKDDFHCSTICSMSSSYN